MIVRSRMRPVNAASSQGSLHPSTWPGGALQHSKRTHSRTPPLLGGTQNAEPRTLNSREAREPRPPADSEGT